jgi:hypothetical protein
MGLNKEMVRASSVGSTQTTYRAMSVLRKNLSWPHEPNRLHLREKRLELT